MSLKNPVTPPGIDPGAFRLVQQRLNRYATPGPFSTCTKFNFEYDLVVIRQSLLSTYDNSFDLGSGDNTRGSETVECCIPVKYTGRKLT